MAVSTSQSRSPQIFTVSQIFTGVNEQELNERPVLAVTTFVGLSWAVKLVFRALHGLSFSSMA